MPDSKTSPTTGKVVKLTLLGWLSMLGFDFFLHAGLLARLYAEQSPFLLPPDRAFALIPVGYLSFLVLAGMLAWLLMRLGIRDWREGAAFGLKLGVLIWGAFVLGLLSISTAAPSLLVGWFFGQTAEVGIAGMVVGSGLAQARLVPLLIKVLIFVIAAFLVTVAMQSFGFAPAIRR
jgi:hypothetical protein